MTVIQKTVCVPENRQIVLDLPVDIPVGDFADITVTVNQSVREARAKALLGLAGAWAGSKVFEGDSVALIREMRDEW